MGIVYSKADRTFTIQTKNTTYQMQVDPYGFLLHLYYGKKTDGSCMDYLLTYYDRGFSGNPFDAGDDRTYSMDTVRITFSMENIRFRVFRQSMRMRRRARHWRS